VERNLYWVTDGVYQSVFLVIRDGVVVFDAPPSIGNNTRRAAAEVAAAEGAAPVVAERARPAVAAVTARGGDLIMVIRDRG
jgi:hypothetical protein